MQYDCAIYSEDLSGLARECPECKIIAHYEVHGFKEVTVHCPDCCHTFTVQKYKRGERPKNKY